MSPEAPRFTRLEKLVLGVIFGGLITGFLTYILGGSGALGLWWLRLQLGGSDAFFRHVGTMVAVIVGFLVRGIVDLPTITVPIATGNDEPPRVQRIWYRPGSLALDGDLATWKTWQGGTGEVNRRLVQRRTTWGGQLITQEVSSTRIGRRVVYETKHVEATRSRAEHARMRVLADELARERTRPRGSP